MDLQLLMLKKYTKLKVDIVYFSTRLKSRFLCMHIYSPQHKGSIPLISIRILNITVDNRI